MSKSIKVAIAGVGNCASALIQGISFYKSNSDGPSIGLMHPEIGGYRPQDIEIVAAFDIDKRKVGKKLKEAIFSPPNNTLVFFPNVSEFEVEVQMAPILDGVSPHMEDYSKELTFVPSEQEPVDVVSKLVESGAEILLNYVPVGSEHAARFYAECCLEAGVSFINCMPTFIVSNKVWGKRFEKAGLPCVGDDIKSQVGATIVHRTLVSLFKARGATVDKTYQLNVGGNTDFLNMLNRDRLGSKKISKTEAVRSILNFEIPYDNVHIGPSDWVPFLKDKKLCFLRIEGRGWGGVPLSLELRLEVEDSPNSAGSVIDAIRACKIARERGIGGPLISASAHTMKHPPVQMQEHEALKCFEEFIRGERER